MGKVGIQETKEGLLAVLALALILTKQFKDGAQVTDASELYEKIFKNEEVKAKMLAAYEGYDKIPEEVKDIDYKEAIELLMVASPEVIKIVEALKE